MGTNKLVEKLEEFFNLSKKKQLKKHEKLQKIIRELEKKKSKLEHNMQKEREIDATGSRYLALQQKSLVISRLICRAEQKDRDD